MGLENVLDYFLDQHNLLLVFLQQHFMLVLVVAQKYHVDFSFKNGVVFS